MKGSPAHQVKLLYQKSGIDQIGHSKHEAKAAARENIAAGNNSRSATWHNIGKEIGIHSYATQNAYRDVWRHTLQYARSNFQIRDIEKITGEHVAAYLQSKVENGVKHATFAQYAAAIEKLEVALNMYSSSHDRGKTYSFSETIKPIREQASKNLEHFNGHREYREPAKVINEIKKDTYKIVAKLQYEAGLQIAIRGRPSHKGNEHDSLLATVAGQPAKDFRKRRKNKNCLSTGRCLPGNQNSRQ